MVSRLCRVTRRSRDCSLLAVTFDLVFPPDSFKDSDPPRVTSTPSDHVFFLVFQTATSTDELEHVETSTDEKAKVLQAFSVSLSCLMGNDRIQS